MFLFPLYIAIVWAALWQLRRTWVGAAALAAAVVGVWLIASVCVALFPSQGWIEYLMPMYAGVLAVGGAMVLSQSRVAKEFGCRGCGYDLAGLTAPLCPECGTRTADAVPAARNTAPLRAGARRPSRPDVRERVERFIESRPPRSRR